MGAVFSAPRSVAGLHEKVVRKKDLMVPPLRFVAAANITLAAATIL